MTAKDKKRIRYRNDPVYRAQQIERARRIDAACKADPLKRKRVMLSKLVWNLRQKKAYRQALLDAVDSKLVQSVLELQQIKRELRSRRTWEKK